MTVESRFITDLPLKNQTSFKIGGRAKYYLFAETRDELRDALDWCSSRGVPWFVLGDGKNVLIDDRGFDGLVIKLCGELKEIRIDESSGLVHAGAGASLSRLAKVLAKNGVSGYEFACVITDSGGIQEETTYIGKPCLTLRPNTERPVTVTEGTNRLCAVKDLENEVDAILNSGFRPGRIPDLWDGRTAARVTASIGRFLSN